MIAMTKALPIVFAAALTLSACAGLSDTEQRVLTGGAIGGAAGTAIGAIGGNAGLGLAIGAIGGATTGYLYDQHKKSEQRAYQAGVSAGQQQQAARAP
jgi:hypothetical protein